MIDIRRCTETKEFRKCVECQRAIWDWEMKDLKTLDWEVFQIAHTHGGQVFGAFEGSAIVGFLLAFPGVRQGRAYLYSHMLGVLKEYQRHGIGFRLKLLQRTEALERGIEFVETGSAEHGKLPTDRLVVDWWLNSPRVRGAIEGQAPSCGPTLNRIRVPLSKDNETGKLAFDRNAPGAPAFQAEVRNQFEVLLGRGYAVTGIEIDDGYAEYSLEVVSPLNHL